MAILLRFSINYYVELPLVGQAAMEKLEWPEWVELRQSFGAAVNTIVHSRTFRQTLSEGSQKNGWRHYERVVGKAVKVNRSLGVLFTLTNFEASETD